MKKKKNFRVSGKFAPGHSVTAGKNGRKGIGRAAGVPTLLTEINRQLGEQKFGQVRVAIVANAFIRQAEKGSFVHAKEILDRQSGRVAQKVEDQKGKPMKMYIGIPIEGPDAP